MSMCFSEMMLLLHMDDSIELFGELCVRAEEAGVVDSAGLFRVGVVVAGVGERGLVAAHEGFSRSV